MQTSAKKSNSKTTKFGSLLTASIADFECISAAADIIRSTGGRLTTLGVGAIYRQNTSFDSVRWSELRHCLANASPDDGLVFFKAMCGHLGERPMNECASLMRDALQCAWRIKAIEAMPEFFRKKRTENILGLWGLEHMANAFQVLAYSGNGCRFSREEAQATIQALKAIGVRDFPAPSHGEICLHEAASRHTPEALSAFIEGFSEYLNAVDDNGTAPVHLSVLSKSGGKNLRVLLDAGANPKPISRIEGTPMKTAGRVRKFEEMLILIDTGMYDANDVSSAAREFRNEEITGRLQAYHAAMIARQAIDHACIVKPELPRPL